MLPSLFAAKDGARPWSLAHAAIYGAGIGAVAALFKTLGPLRAGAAGSTDAILHIAGAALAFALLCAGAAFLRNLIARRLIWPRMR